MKSGAGRTTRVDVGSILLLRSEALTCAGAVDSAHAAAADCLAGATFLAAG